MRMTPPVPQDQFPDLGLGFDVADSFYRLTPIVSERIDRMVSPVASRTDEPIARKLLW